MQCGGLIVFGWFLVGFCVGVACEMYVESMRPRDLAVWFVLGAPEWPDSARMQCGSLIVIWPGARWVVGRNGLRDWGRNLWPLNRDAWCFLGGPEWQSNKEIETYDYGLLILTLDVSERPQNERMPYGGLIVFGCFVAGFCVGVAWRFDLGMPEI